MLTREQLTILDFWHKIEFFLPFDLEDALKSLPCITSYTEAQLHQCSTKELWAIPNLAKDEEASSYAIFLGIYDKNELTNQLKQVLGDEKHLLDENLIEKKPSKSCMAKIKLNQNGSLDYSSIKVDLSTTPWAISKIKEKGLEALDFTTFEQELNQLKQDIQEFARHHLSTSEDEPLSGQDLLALYEILGKWVNFKTENKALPLIYIQKNKRKKKETKPSDLQNEEQKNDNNIEVDIAILNSFYARDIADVMRLHQTQFSPVLDSYLSKAQRKIDLYGNGIAKISEHLQPKYLNSGRWLSDSQYHMSLMQQFAINTIFKEQNQVLFSVNGPPGTGKTTLLKDIFAENIVQRARELASYKRVKDCFEEGTHTVKFNTQILYLRKLKENLTGFEMVVTSSNNAAVQNISKELPQNGALGETEWRDETGLPKFTYLQQIAQNIQFLTEESKHSIYQKFDPKITQSPWGLISCVLGNRKYRKAFITPFMDSDPDAINYNKELYQGIRQWYNKNHSLSFAEAKKAFATKDKEVQDRIAQLQRYSELMTLQGKSNIEEQLVKHQTQREQLSISLENKRSDLAKNQQKLTACQYMLDNIQQRKALVGNIKENWLNKLFQKKKLLEQKQERTALLEEERLQLSEWHSLNEHKDQLEKLCNVEYQKQNNLENELKKLMQQKAKLQAEIDSLSKEFEHIAFTLDANELENENWQINGLWADQKLNLLRSQLFQTALQLHEVWLSEAFNEKGVKHNIFAINNLLSGQSYLVGNLEEQEKAAKLIWQMLFMIVPVISTTFASFRSQFKHLRANSLGWVFVDEAGQAVPQAAVGALWRAQKAVVVGDPLQIEPVFTTPVDFTERLAEASHLPKDFCTNPHGSSVQTLADKANPFGAEIKKIWIGSPLRVHRRCFDPMFSISNEIAYEGKMIFAGKHRLPPENTIDLGHSAWVNIEPNESIGLNQRQREIAFVKKLLIRLIKCLNGKPPIYVITPFREMKDELKRQIKLLPDWNRIGIKGKDWVDENVGTVHTFQGKENQIVLLVLGCDEKNIRSASALVSKPNLINVAATRAKHRFFIVGNRRVWTKHYALFDETFSLLGKQNISGEAMLEQAERIIFRKQN